MSYLHSLKHFLALFLGVLILLSLGFLPISAVLAEGDSGDSIISDEIGIMTPAREAYMVDVATGRVLISHNSNEHMPTSSMSKLMTALVVIDAVANGRISMDDEFHISENAWAANVEGSKMFIEVGEDISIANLLRGLIIISGNDAAMALAEGLAGDEAAFVRSMNRRAADIGMSESHFANAAGFPDENHYSTAHDLAILAGFLIEEYPQYYNIFSERGFGWGDVPHQPNRLNRIFEANIGADGLKTGHTEIAGYGAITSAVQNGRRVILVLNGLESSRQRENESIRLLRWGLNNFNSYDIFLAGERIDDATIWQGEAATVPLIAEEDLRLTLSDEESSSLEMILHINEPVAAPIVAGTVLGQLEVRLDGMESRFVNVLAGADVEKIGFMGRLVGNSKRIMFGDLLNSEETTEETTEGSQIDE